MYKYLIVLLILLGILTVTTISCGYKERRLTINDLIFPNPEKHAIVKNHIFLSIGIDTGCWKEKSQIAKLDSLLKYKIRIDSFGVIGSEISRYDSLGNMIYARDNSCDFYCQNLGYNTNFVFDSNGMVIASYNHQPDSIYYFFIPDSFKLRGFHYLLKDRNSNFTETFMFDSSGKLKFSVKHINDTSYYTYDRSDRLIAIKKIFYYSVHSFMTTEMHFYYKNELLDSVIETINNGSFDSYINKYYYDFDGLLSKSVLQIRENQTNLNKIGWLKKPRTRLYYHLSSK